MIGIKSCLFFWIQLLITSNKGVSSFSVVLPSQLQNAVQQGLLVEEPIPNLYILGTVHIGSKSADEARVLIEAVRPTKVIVELPPSRLSRVRAKIKAKKEDKSSLSNSERVTFLRAIGMYPSLALAGWSKGGISGFLFSTSIVWPSLLKRSITGNEEEDELPRVNEFDATVEAGDKFDAEIIAGDLEFEELIQSIVSSMTPISWMKVGGRLSLEAIGLQPTDPIRRKKGESLADWEARRRSVSTARSSRTHGEISAPEIHNTVVVERDEKFAQLCLEALESNERVVCVCGLVHLDGILEKLQDDGTFL